MAGLDHFFPHLTRPQAAEVLRLVSELDEFKGHWRRVKETQAERLASLRQVATIESAASSTRIEGAELSDEEVAQVLGGLHVDSFRIATHPDGRSEVIFQTATPFDTPRLMTELVTDTSAALADADNHPLTVIARFVVQFLAIHPFQDGNGRLSRALTTLLLLRAGYEYVPYASLERIVEDNKLRYYAALRGSQLAMRGDPADFGEWLIFLLGALRAQKRSLEAKLDVERSMLRLSSVQERIVAAVRSKGRVTTPTLVKELEIPDRTVRYHLDLLVRRHLLAAHGQRKGRYYTIGGDDAVPPPISDPGTNIVIAEIYELGGRISRSELLALMKRHGYDGRVVGLLHGRRLAHLRRNAKTGESSLTTRGEEMARQHLFATKLARGEKSALEQ